LYQNFHISLLHFTKIFKTPLETNLGHPVPTCISVVTRA
jgi:hypothetical protein